MMGERDRLAELQRRVAALASEVLCFKDPENHPAELYDAIESAGDSMDDAARKLRTALDLF